MQKPSLCLLLGCVLFATSACAQDALLSPDWLVPKNPAVRVISPGVNGPFEAEHISPIARSSSGGGGIGPQANQVALRDCPYDTTRAEECRVHWRPLALSSIAFLTFDNVGNVYTGYWYRWETTHGKWWDRYVNSVEGWRWNKWTDNNPALDQYVGHPMMGAITNSIWIQNDPKGMTLEFGNNWPYWRSRLRALAFSTLFSFEWKIGPIGEASIGHNGDHFEYTDRAYTNETGDVELVSTPVGGLLWTVGEDWVDLHIIKHLEEKSRNPFLLMTYQIMNPGRATANIFRFRAPWYRDSRVVKATSRWSDPDDAGVQGASYLQPARETEDTGWGGPHELGVTWGYSPTGGPIWGYKTDVRYMPINLRYSYLLTKHNHWAFRYAPEITALSMLDESNWGKTNKYTRRRRTYGAGASPEGFQVDFAPNRRVQPFLSNNGGFIYYTDRVLSPQGSQFMYTIDFGAGVNVYTKRNEAMTFGFRYDHLSNGDMSRHNPGTDAQIFYFGVSRFHGSTR